MHAMLTFAVRLGFRLDFILFMPFCIISIFFQILNYNIFCHLHYNELHKLVVKKVNPLNKKSRNSN